MNCAFEYDRRKVNQVKGEMKTLLSDFELTVSFGRFCDDEEWPFFFPVQEKNTMKTIPKAITDLFTCSISY
jgi:hypothetical protein